MPYRLIDEGQFVHYLDFHPTNFPYKSVGRDPLIQSGSAKTPVVLLHGLGASGYSWLFQMDFLTKAGYRTIAPDFRGFGQSSLPNDKLSISLLAHDLCWLLDELSVDRVHLVGLSLGGAVAQDFAIQNSRRVEKLILISTANRFRPDSLRLALYYIWRYLLGFTLDLESQAAAVSHRIFYKDGQDFLRKNLIDQILSADRRAYRRTILALRSFDSGRNLPGIKSPTLVITGLEDTTVSPRMQAKLVDGIRGAEQAILPESGHGLTVEEPDRVNRLILDFLEN
jgi:pimeloyl-ACP methyl ester carboxylesterase